MNGILVLLPLKENRKLEKHTVFQKFHEMGKGGEGRGEVQCKEFTSSEMNGI